jgi:hypothetical protein
MKMGIPELRNIGDNGREMRRRQKEGNARVGLKIPSETRLTKLKSR